MDMYSVFDLILQYHLNYLESDLNKIDIERNRLSPEEALRQTATVRLGFGRHVGKTAYLARTATAEDTILAFAESMAHIHENIKSFRTSKCSTVISLGDLDSKDGLDYLPDKTRDVWIDDAQVIDKADLDRLYLALTGKCRRFILIG